MSIDAGPARHETRRAAHPGRAAAPAVRHLKRALAIAISLGALVFLALALRRTWHEFTHLVVEPGPMLAAGGLSIVYAGCFGLLFASWYYTLGQSAPARVPVRRAAYIYFLANVARYLPGNVFHFAGRQVLGARAGWRHAEIARATLLEIAAVVASICAILAVAAAVDPAAMAAMLAGAGWPLADSGLRLGAVVALAAAVAALAAAARLRLFERALAIPFRAAAVALALCGCFFALNALMAIALSSQLAALPAAAPAAAMGAAYLLAWLAGFVVPGAPGGLGVREAVLVLLVSAHDEALAAPALAVGLGMRVVTTLGDVISATGVYALCRGPAAADRAAPSEGSDG